MTPKMLALACGVCLAACAKAPLPEVNRLTERTGVITLPDPATGTCFADDVTPAVIDTETEQVLLQAEEIGPNGELLTPALYETQTRQVIVQERKEQRFEALCEAQLTPSFVSDLQRALGARAFYNGPVSGELNWRTRRAVRLFQQDQGIDSAIISLRTAQELGLTAFAFDT